MGGQAGEVLQQVQDVLQRARDEEVLLQQPQLFTDLRFVVGVKHLGDVLGDHLILDRAVVVPGVERLQCQCVDRVGAPQRQGVAGVDAVALDRGAVVDALDDAFGDPTHPRLAVGIGVVLGAAAPAHLVVQLRLGDLPGVAGRQPVVGAFHLDAVADLLVENPELVADSVADRRTFQGGQRIQVAGRQPAQPAVAQTRFLLAGQDLVVVLAECRESFPGLLLKVQVEQVVAQMGPEQELRGQIDRHLAGQVEVGLGGVGPALLHPVADRQCQRVVVVLRLQQLERSPQGVAQVVLDGLAQAGRAHAGADVGRGVGARVSGSAR